METKINIDGLTEAELIDLNNRIVERLRFLHQARAHSHMLEFSVGDRVSFQPEGHDALFGVLTRYNRKIVTYGRSETNAAHVFREAVAQRQPASTSRGRSKVSARRTCVAPLRTA